MGFRERYSIPDLGVGVGFRSEHTDQILGDVQPPMDWFEVVSEKFIIKGGKLLANLDKLLSHYKVAPHGVCLSIGATKPLDKAYLAKLKAVVDRINPPWASDHFCWCGTNKVDLHDLLPLPLTAENAQYIADRVRRVQDYLGRPFALENASTYLTFASSNMPEWEFVATVAEKADCGLLLDVNNVFVSSFNHGFDPIKYIEAIPVDRVVQFHLAGHTDCGTHLLDTHSAHVRAEVWDLYRRAVRRFGAVSTIIEWDSDIPSWEDLSKEAAMARDARNEVLAERGQGPAKKAKKARPGKFNFPEADLDDVPKGPKQLREIQAFMAPALIGTVCIDKSPELTEGADKYVAKGLRMSPAESLDVYRHQFWLRHTEAMWKDYPEMAQALGNKFNKFCTDYLVAFPPTAFSMRDVGGKLIEFAKSHAPWSEDAFLYDCVRADWAHIRARDDADAPELEPSAIANATADDWNRARVTLHPSLQRNIMSYPVHKYRLAVIQGESPARPEPAKTFLITYRAKDLTRYTTLIPGSYLLLSLLSRGVPLGAASQRIAMFLQKGNKADVAGEVGSWFQAYMARGWIVGINFSRRSKRAKPPEIRMELNPEVDPPDENPESLIASTAQCLSA